MKTIPLIIFLLFSPILLIADDNAALQMRLANDTLFRQRIEYLLMREAFVVLVEPSNTPNHVNRYNFALLVQRGVSGIVSSGYATALVGRPNLVGETTTCNEQVCVTTATDAEIASQIATDWNLWSGQ